VVPDVSLEKTEILRKEATRNGIELVLLTTPTTPINQMKAIVEAAEGFAYLVSSVGVTGAWASVSNWVQTLLQEIKEATTKPVAVGFGISNLEHVKQVAGWGADGVNSAKPERKQNGKEKEEEMEQRVEEFLRVTCCAFVVTGYGLTETCAPTTLGFPDEMCMIGTVGPVGVYNELCLEEVSEMGYNPLEEPPCGEVCVRGKTVFAAYHKNPELTTESIKDGWFHIGDIGEDQDLVKAQFPKFFLGDKEVVRGEG